MATECYREFAFPSLTLMDDHPANCFGGKFPGSLLPRERKIVCVTSGNSYLGAQLTKKLLASGYLVRVTIQSPGHFEDMMELMREEEIRQLESVVVARMVELQSLREAFRGCHAIFHTSTFIDPSGISGYTERMAFLETEAAKNVIEACSGSAYVKRCIFTSSLLASVWKGGNAEQTMMNETSWSDEEFCRQNKLWLALGKTKAEKVAWRRATELKVNLVTICPGLLMAPSFPNAHPETSIPYLKGGRRMLQQGVLAMEDASKIAEAHVRVYEDMDYGACGRYICYGRIIRRLEEAISIENQLKLHGLLSGEINNNNVVDFSTNIIISNARLNKLLARASQHVPCSRYSYYLLGSI